MQDLNGIRRAPATARSAALLAVALFAAAAPAALAKTLRCGELAPDAARIAVAGGSITEILYELGEQARIVGADRTSNYPAAALELPQIGYVRNLSAEGLLSLSPTLVMGEHDMGPPAVVAQLELLGVDLLRLPQRFTPEGIADKVRCIAAALGRPEAGRALVAKLLAEVSTAPPDGEPLRGIVLLGLRNGAPVAAGTNTSGDGLLTIAGAVNAMTAFEGWKPVADEAIASIAPAFIVIPERGLRDAGGLEALLDHPALRFTPAARERRVIALDGMAMLGFGPRTVAAANRLRSSLASRP